MRADLSTPPPARGNDAPEIKMARPGGRKTSMSRLDDVLPPNELERGR